MFRFVMPELSPGGLGNQFMSWGKAYLAHQELHAHLLHPAFSRNSRSLGWYFRTPPWDWVFYRFMMKVLPVYTISKEEYLDTGEHDYAGAVRIYAKNMG